MLIVLLSATLLCNFLYQGAALRPRYKLNLSTVENLKAIKVSFKSPVVAHALTLLRPADHSGGGPHDKRDVFWGQHAVVRQRQRPPADFNPGYQRQHSDPPKAAVLPAADPPGAGRLDAAPRPRPEHRPGPAGSHCELTRICIFHPATNSYPLLAKKYLCVILFRSVHNILWDFPAFLYIKFAHFTLDLVQEP